MTVSPPAPARLRHLVDGEWLSGTGAEIRSTDPTRPHITVAAGSAATADDVAAAVSAARHAMPRWASLPLHDRGAVLLAAAQILERNATNWGTELATEEGKTKAEGIAEVSRAGQIFRYYGNAGDRRTGDLFSSPRPGEQILVTRKPVGIVGIITPFNFPIAIPAWKIAPALVYGNAVVWKPASTVPLLAMRLAEALTSAGLPHGVLNLVLGGSQIGNGIVDHPDVDAITFTGSTGVGRRIAAAAAARGIPAQCEMGGKNAAVVLDDADLDLAVDQVVLGAFRSSGQKCTATSRLIVTTGVADRFCDMLASRVADLQVGDPLENGTELGPVVSHAAKETIGTGIDTALSQGAKVLAGADRYSDELRSAGHFVAPTVLELRDRSADIWTEELFGPVLAVHRVSDTDEAFELADDSDFGLSAALFTQDITTALRAVDRLDVGILHINSESAGADPHVPFGGAKKSGLGPKEQGEAAREFFTHTTTVYLRGGSAGR